MSSIDQREGYEVGFSVPGPNFKDSAHFRIAMDSEDRGMVDFHVQLSGNGRGIGSVYQQLTPGEARELSLALERAADAAERSRE